MKIRKLSDEELKKEINYFGYFCIVEILAGSLGVVLSFKNYLFGFLGITCLIVASLMLLIVLNNRLILEIRHQGGKP